MLRGAFITALFITTVACSVSDQVRVEIDPFTIPQGSYYTEQTVELPEDVQNQAVRFDAARVHYTVERSSGFTIGGGTITLSFYASPRTEADAGNDCPQSGDELVFTVQLESDDDLGTGSQSSSALVDILNSGQESFVVALETESSDITAFDGELILDLELELNYTVSFP